MAISQKLSDQMSRASWIRRMFEEAARLKKERGENQVLDFSLGNPIVPPPPEFSSGLRTVVEQDFPAAHRYMQNAGLEETRKAIAGVLQKEHGLPFTEDHILMSCGAAGGLNVVLKSLLDPGDEVIIAAPYFPEYLFYIDNHSGVPRIVECDGDFQIDPDSIAQAVTPRTKAMIVNSPNNPTGAVYSADRIHKLCRVLGECQRGIGHSIYLLSDEAYSSLIYDNVELPSIPAVYANSIVVGSFSKNQSLAGERIGYIGISPRADDAGRIYDACVTATRILGFVNAPALMQRVLPYCLNSPVDMAFYQRNRDVLYEALKTSGYNVQRPLGAFYIFPECPENDDKAFCARLTEDGLIAVPGSGFGRPGFMRLAFSVDHTTVDRAVPILARAARGKRSQ